MPYYIYERTIQEDKITLNWIGEEASLGGCTNGIIAKELKKILSPIHNPPLGWSIPISKIFNAKNLSFIIDLNPKGNDSNLAELDTVFGFSYPGWTPILLKLKNLTDDFSR